MLTTSRKSVASASALALLFPHTPSQERPAYPGVFRAGTDVRRGAQGAPGGSVGRAGDSSSRGPEFKPYVGSRAYF